MRKINEINLYCEKVNRMLAEIKDNVEFLHHMTNNMPATYYRNKQIAKQIETIGNKCFELNLLSNETKLEVNNDAETA